MPSLLQRLASALSEVLAVEQQDDGALTVRHDGTLASLQVVEIAADLDLVSLTQILAWELPLTRKLRDAVTEQARDSQLGTVIFVEKPAPATGAARRNSGKTADIMLRYNFPGSGLTDAALRTLILLVLDKGADIGRALPRD